MHGGRHGLREVQVQQLAAVLRDAEVPSEEGLRRGRAEQDKDPWLDDRELGFEPRAAGSHLGPVRLLVDAALPASLPLEVLHGVRDVRRRPVDAGRLERLVEEPARGPDERPAGLVLLIARLLANEHCRGLAGALTEDRLRPDLPEVATLAAGGRLPQRGQAQPLREEVRSRSGCRRSRHVPGYSLDRGIRDTKAAWML